MNPSIINLKTQETEQRGSIRPWIGLLLLFTGFGILSAGPSAGQSLKNPAISGESWPFYGGNAGGMRYSPLEQINDSNVRRLKVAWIYRTGELKKYKRTPILEKAAFEPTPVMIHQTLYFSTPSDRVIAVDAGTGQEKWVFDPEIDLNRDYSEAGSRLLAAW